MRLIKANFSGYKRLKSTKCNLDGKLIAVLGPNEAGKSSVLNGLAWLTEGGRLEGFKRTRNNDIADDQEVIKVEFALSDDDLASIAEIETDVRPSSLFVSRTAGGTLSLTTEPLLRRRREEFDDARSKIDAMVELIAAANSDGDIEHADTLRAQLEQLSSRLEAYDQMSDEEDGDLINSVRESAKEFLELDEEVYSDTLEKGLVRHSIEKAEAELADSLARVDTTLTGPHPYLVACKKLWKRSPDFVLFTERDRTLLPTYELSDDEIRTDTPRALKNVLAIAGTDIGEIYEAVVGNDKTRLRTLLKGANKQLSERMRDAWRQADLSVSINTDATTLEVLIEEYGRDGFVTTIDERSDGLRTFIALVCFLQTRPTSYPPILLIDEAETHLHLDAQADLVEVLSKQEVAQQVIYTTHSPGCLPADLGTGVRFVEPDPGEPGLSRLRNDFWQTSVPGFGPMLFAMGAGAAAFSACRHAVLCEGPSEMILLPTLLRLANDLDVLPYQVAPGLSVARQEDLAATAIAAKVLYLTDGDGGGRDLSRQLVAAGIQVERIYSLPDGHAVEDLIDPELYLSTVAEMLNQTGSQNTFPRISEIESGKTISKGLDIWAKGAGVKVPGKIAVASRLATKITVGSIPQEAARELKRLHGEWMIHFKESRNLSS